MIKSVFVSVLVLLFFNAFSQEILFYQDISLKSVFKDKRESYPVVNSETGTLALFLLDNNTINVKLFDRDFKITMDQASDRPKDKFNTLLGSCIRGSQYNLFFTNDKENEFYIQTFEFNPVQSSGKMIPFKSKEERFVESFSNNNRFYLLTVVRKTSVLKIYTFADNEKIDVNEIDLSEYKFANSEFSKLYDVFYDTESGLSSGLQLQKINNQDPNPLELTSKQNKIYCSDDKLLLTFDNESDETKLIAINLNDFSFRVDNFRQGTIRCDDMNRIKSNSYVYKNHLFQLKACKQELCFTVFDLSTQQLVKEYKAIESDDLSFKNTPLIQEGGTTVFTRDSKKELDNTEVFLRKMTSGDIGISVYQTSAAVELTLGGYKEVQRYSGSGMGTGGGMMMTSPGISMYTPQGTISSAPTFHYNPTSWGYNSYVNTRSTFIKCLFDNETFEHVPGEVTKNAFDKIKDFSKKNEDYIASETIFRMDNFYVYGYYNKHLLKYFLMKFTD